MKQEHKKVIIEMLKDEIKSNVDLIKDISNIKEIEAWKNDNKLYKEIIMELKIK